MKRNTVIAYFAYFLELVGVQCLALGAHFMKADVCQHRGLNSAPLAEGLLNCFPPLPAV